MGWGVVAFLGGGVRLNISVVPVDYIYVYQKCTSIYIMCVYRYDRASSNRKRLSMEVHEFRLCFFLFVQVIG